MQITPLECLLPSTDTHYDFTLFEQTEALMAEYCGNRVSCRNLSKKLQVLLLTSKYMLSLLMFIVQNKNLFSTNTENHNIDTRQSKIYTCLKQT